MTSFPKNSLVRFACSGGGFAPDPTGKMNGRGVYLCRSLDCFDMAIKKKRLRSASGTPLAKDEAAMLREGYERMIVPETGQSVLEVNE
jgi:predicted RNA-binding protein YlxR (DUF448 family)